MMIMKFVEESKRSAAEAAVIVAEDKGRGRIQRVARAKMMMMMKTWTPNCLPSCKPWKGVVWTRKGKWWTMMTVMSMKVTTKLRKERGTH